MAAELSPHAALEFYFDVSSPYSYLAAQVIDALGARIGRPVLWRPLLLGGVFRSTSHSAGAMAPAKARWMLADLQRWAAHYDVPFHFMSRFPQNSLLAMRTLTAVQRADGHDAMRAAALECFRVGWVDDADLGAPDVLAGCLDRVGLDGAGRVASASDPDVKAALRAVTDGAVARGVFGAPTVFLGDEMHWGNDRLELLAARHPGPSAQSPDA